MAQPEQDMTSLLDAIIEKKTQNSESKVRDIYTVFNVQIFRQSSHLISKNMIYSLIYVARLSGVSSVDRKSIGSTFLCVACRVWCPPVD